MTTVPPLGLAYRDWLLQLSRIEADNGCPRLFAMKSDVAMYFADNVSEWDAELRYELMAACVKNLFENNYGYPPLPKTVMEIEVLERWDYPYFGHWRTPGKPQIEITWPRTGARSIIDANKMKAALRQDEAEHRQSKLNAGLLKQTIREVMLELWGTPEVGGPLWRFTREAYGLSITTHLDFGVRRPDQFGYWQVVSKVTGQQRRRLLESGGISALLGWPQSRWRYLADADIPDTAGLLLRLCNEFVDALPEMVDRSMH